MALIFECPYGLSFPDAPSTNAAIAANNGSLYLGNLPPMTAITANPSATLVQAGFTSSSQFFQGGTGAPGIPNPAVSFALSHLASPGVVFTPAGPLSGSSNSLAVTASGSVGGVPIAPTSCIFEWVGFIIGPGVAVPSNLLQLPVPITGKFQVQTLSYTGDGAASRHIASTLDLSVGRVLIWLFPDEATAPSYRSNDVAMTGTAFVGGGSIDATSGIGSFDSTGFTVIRGVNAAVHSSNNNTVKYTATIFSDTTPLSSKSYMFFGTYTGRATVHTNGAFQAGSVTVIGGFVAAADVGRIFTSPEDGGVAQHTVVSVNVGIGFNMEVVAQSTGTFNIDSLAASQVATGAPWVPTLVWDLNNDGVYRSAPEFGSGDLSVDLSVVANPQTNMISALIAGGFRIGTDASVNFNNHTYFWSGFNVPVGDPARRFFDTHMFTGTGAPLVIGGLFLNTGVTPALVTARQQDSTLSDWRGLTQTGTNSTGMDGTNNAATGIIAMGSSQFTVGTAFANNKNFFGWAVATTSGASGTPSGFIIQGPPGTNPLAPATPSSTQGSMAPPPQWQLQRFDIKPRREEHR